MEDSELIEESTFGSSSFSIMLLHCLPNGDEPVYAITWYTSCDITEELSPPPKLVAYMHSSVYGDAMPEKVGTKVIVCTEYKRAGLTFRCHPNYRRHGPWFDWASFQFEVVNADTGETTEEIMPCQIIGIISPEYNPDVTEVMMIVSCCLERNEEGNSVLLKGWKYEDDVWYRIAAATLHSPVFVVSGLDDEGDKSCTIMPCSE